MLHEIKILEINAAWINANLMEKDGNLLRISRGR